MAIRDRKGVWYADFTVNLRRTVRSTGTSIREEAQEIHDRWKSEAWRETRLGEKPSVAFEVAAGAWAKARANNRDIESSKDKLRFVCEVKYRGRRVGSMALGDITPDVIDAIVEAKRDIGKKHGGRLSKVRAPVADATLNRYLAAVGAVLHFAHAKGWLDAVPKIQMLDENAGPGRWITREQAAALIAELPEHLAIMARFALATGLRRSNVTHLAWEQVDLARRVAWVHESDSKSKQAIAIPLSDDAVEILKGQADKDKEWVFPYKGGPVTRVYGDAFKAAMERAGIDPKFRWHDFRHTWATWHVMGGTPLGELMKLGGWHSYEMVLRYSKFSPGHLAQFANNSAMGQIGDTEQRRAA